MKNLIAILFICGIISNSFAQNGQIWSKNFFTDLTNYYSNGPSIQIENNSVKVIGRSNKIGAGQRVLIISYNMSGDTLSTTNYGKDSINNNVIVDYKFDANNNLYILHRDYLEFYKSKIVIQKYSPDGKLSWVKQIKSLADTSYSSESIGLINDTTLFITAYKEYNYPTSPGGDVIGTISIPWVLAYFTNGDKIWEKELDPETEISYFLYPILPHDNSAFLFGYNNLTSKCMVKVGLDKSITTLNDIEIENGINHILYTSDNNLLVASWNLYTVTKINYNGKKIWSSYYQANDGSDEITSIIQDNNDNIYVTGRHYSGGLGTNNYTNADILTIKYDKNGHQIWENIYKYGTNNADIGNTVVIKDGYVYVGGESQRLGISTDYDYVILKLDSATGENIGTYRYNGLNNGDDAVTGIDVFDDGQVCLTGLSLIGTSYNWTTQLLSDVITSSIKPANENDGSHIYPNPVSKNGKLTIFNNRFHNYTIPAINGKLMESGTLPSLGNCEIILTNLNTGVYVLNLKNDNEYITEKIIVK